MLLLRKKRESEKENAKIRAQCKAFVQFMKDFGKITKQIQEAEDKDPNIHHDYMRPIISEYLKKSGKGSFSETNIESICSAVENLGYEEFYENYKELSEKEASGNGSETKGK